MHRPTELQPHPPLCGLLPARWAPCSPNLSEYLAVHTHHYDPKVFKGHGAEIPLRGSPRSPITSPCIKPARDARGWKPKTSPCPVGGRGSHTQNCTPRVRVTEVWVRERQRTHIHTHGKYLPWLRGTTAGVPVRGGQVPVRRVCICVCVRACRGLAPERPRTPGPSPASPPAPSRRPPAPYLEASLCLLQRERRIDTADGAGACLSPSSERVRMRACGCSSSPSPNANTPPRRGEPGRRRGKRRAKSESARLDSSSIGVQGGRNVQQKGREMWIDFKHPFPPPNPGA